MQGPNGVMPPIFVLERDHEQLSWLVDSHLADRFPYETDALRGELERAVVLRSDRLPAGVATLYSRVHYVDVGTGRENHAVLVLPWHADPANGRVSVLAPLATALLGLRVGDSIRWQTPSGRVHVWRVLEVAPEPES